MNSFKSKNMLIRIKIDKIVLIDYIEYLSHSLEIFI